MGLFCVNFHFRTADDKALSVSLKKRGVTRFRIAPARNGWTTLYEERASQQDDMRIRELASGLSGDLHVPAIAFMVHDSDIACYWLFDDGRLLDEFNSCPDYFDDSAGDGDSQSTGGDADLLLRYCRPGVRRDELEEILASGSTFAEEIIERLAEALGIDAERALSDHRDPEDDDDPDGSNDFGDDDDRGGGPDVVSFREGLAGKLATLLGTKSSVTVVDPQAAELVRAASEGNVGDIDRLLAAGVAVDGEAPAPLPGADAMAGMGKVFAGGLPQVAMTPLLAAVLNKHRPAVERLLDGGADANRAHPIFGTAVHAAAGTGDASVLELLLDCGGDVNARNAQGQTPLAVVAAGRASRERIAQAQEMMKAMGMKLPGNLEQLAKATLPMAGWDACERLLKARTGG